MSLAYIKYLGFDKGKHRFQADAGNNHFFQYKIGERTRKLGGIEVLDSVSFESPVSSIKRNIINPLKTDFLLEVPGDEFKERGDKIQLLTFKNDHGKSPAISDVLRIALPVIGRNSGFLPKLSFSKEVQKMKNYQVENKAFEYRESGVSEAMFWGQLMGALPNIIGKAAPILKQLIGGGSSKGGDKNAQPDLGNIIETITSLLKNLGANNGAAAAKSLQYYQNGDHLNQFAHKTITPEGLNLIKDDPEKLFKTVNDSALKLSHKPKANYPYSEGQFIQAIAALAPIVKDLLKLGVENDEKVRTHLENMAKLLNDPTIIPLLNSLSIQQSIQKEIHFDAHPKVDLEFINMNLIELNGQNRSVYLLGKPLYFPIRINTKDKNAPSRPIPRVIVQVVVQDSDSMENLLVKTFKFKGIKLNAPLEDLYIDPAESDAFPLNKNLKIEISFIWQGKNGKKYGALKNHFFTLIDDRVFDKIGAVVGEPANLNDVIQHRPFWHKIWEGKYPDSKRWELDIELKYYYTLDVEDDEPARMKTKIKIEKDKDRKHHHHSSRRKVNAKVKSGMEVSLEMLNALLSDLNESPLSEKQLEALRSPSFKNYFNQVAHTNLEFKGKDEDTCVLWAYLEVTKHKIQLIKVEKVNALGQVTETAPEEVIFPRPSAVHFVGTKTA